MHGDEPTRKAIDASASLFGRGGDLADIDLETRKVCLTVSKSRMRRGKSVRTGPYGDRIAQAGVSAGLFKSISEARKTIKSGGVYVNNVRVEDEEQLLGDGDFLKGRFVVLRRGKKALGVVARS